MELRYDASSILVATNVISSSCRLTALATAQMIANHRVGLSKLGLQSHELIVDFLSLQSQLADFCPPRIPFPLCCVALFEKALMRFAGRSHLKNCVAHCRPLIETLLA